MMNKIRRVDFYASDWIAGVSGLALGSSAVGVYIQLCALCYAVGSASLPEDETISRIAWQLGDDPRTVRAAINRLEKAAKLTRDAGEIEPNRVRDEIERSEKRFERFSNAGKKGGKSRRLDQSSLKPCLNNDQANNQQPAINNQQPAMRARDALVAAAHSSPGFQDTTPPNLAVVDGIDPRAVVVIREFDTAIVAAFGSAAARPWPVATDAVTASRWLQSGADPGFLRETFARRCRAIAAANQPPPKSLRYFDAAVSDALRAGKASPAVHPNDRALTLNEIAS